MGAQRNKELWKIHLRKWARIKDTNIQVTEFMSKNIAQEQVGLMAPPRNTTYNMLIEMLLLAAE